MFFSKRRTQAEIDDYIAKINQESETLRLEQIREFEDRRRVLALMAAAHGK